MTGETPGRTRREALRDGGSVAASVGLAGCSDAVGNGETPTESASDTYEACIEPTGCVTFDSVPESYLVYNGGWADMAFALGQREGFLTAGNRIPGFFSSHSVSTCRRRRR